MELLLVASDDPAAERYNWDIDVKDGIAVTVPEGAEDSQEAAIIAYLETNTVPLMPERGTDWAAYLNKQKSLAEIDTTIRENLKDYLDDVLFAPAYISQGGKLAVHMTKVVINTGA